MQALLREKLDQDGILADIPRSLSATKGSGTIEEPRTVGLVFESRADDQICEFSLGVPNRNCRTLCRGEDGVSRAPCVAEMLGGQVTRKRVKVGIEWRHRPKQARKG